VTISSSDALLEVIGGVGKIFDQFSLIVSLVALGEAVFLIIKTILGNLVSTFLRRLFRCAQSIGAKK
jgi:hypothetical protein